MMLANGSACAYPKAPPPWLFEFRFRLFRLRELPPFAIEEVVVVLLGANGSLAAAAGPDGEQKMGSSSQPPRLLLETGAYS